MNFYKPNAIFTPPKMNFIFKSILDNGPLFKIHLQVIKETMLEAIICNNEDTLANGSTLQTLGVKSMVKQDICIQLNSTVALKEHLFHETLSE